MIHIIYYINVVVAEWQPALDTLLMGGRTYLSDDGGWGNGTVQHAVHQVLLVFFLIIIAVIARQLSNYFNQRSWFFADVATVGMCISGGIVAASAIHASIIGTRIAVDNIVFDVTALVTIIAMLYIAGITSETINLVCEAFVVIATVAVVVILIVGVLLIGSVGISREVGSSHY